MRCAGICCTISLCFVAHVITGSFIMAGYKCPEYEESGWKQLQLWTGAMSIVLYFGIYYVIKVFNPRVRFEFCCDFPRGIALLFALIILVAPILSIIELVACIRLPEDTPNRVGGIVIYSVNLILMLPIFEVCRDVIMNYEEEKEFMPNLRDLVYGNDV